MGLKERSRKISAAGYQAMVTDAQKDKIERMKQECSRIQGHLKTMQLISKSAMGNILFYIGVDPGSHLRQKNMKFEKQILLKSERFSGNRFYHIKGKYHVRGYYWIHNGPSAERFFFNTELIENHHPEAIKFCFNIQSRETDLFQNMLVDVFQKDFDFPVGGADVIIDEIISLKIGSDESYAENIRKLINFSSTALFNHHGIC